MADLNELILIDGSSFLYRAYFAVKKQFSTKSGIPTGATFIITRMLQNLRNEFAHDKFVLVFDAKGGSFRNQIYADYKATRPPMPEELKVQLQYVNDIVKAMGFPVISVPNVEADDVLGSYTKAALALGMQVIICTGDKDLAQLVEPNVIIYDTMRNAKYDAAKVKEKYGVLPEHIIDLLALKGDSSDNIPGMKGVGDKTACALINGLGGVYYIKDHVDQIASLDFRGASKFADRFLEQWPQIELSYRLATIKCDVPLPVSIADLPYPQENHDELIKLFEKLEFFRFVAEQKTKMEAEKGIVVGSSTAKVNADPIASQKAIAAEMAAQAASEQSAASAADKEAGDSDDEVIAESEATASEEAQNDGQDILSPRNRRRPVPSLAERLAAHEAAVAAGTISAEDAENLNIAPTSQLTDIGHYRQYFKLVTTTTELGRMIRALKQAGTFALYIEASSTHASDCTIIGVACCCGEEQAFYVPLKHNYLGAPDQLPQSQLLLALGPLLKDPELCKIAYNVKLTRLYLSFLGIEAEGFLPDITVMAHLLDSSRPLDVETMATTYLSYMPLNENNIVPDRMESNAQIDVQLFSYYACERAHIAYRLQPVCYEQVAALSNGFELLDHEMQVLDVLYLMEKCGALVDGKLLKKLSSDLKNDVGVLQDEIYDAAGKKFNIASPRQLSQVLFEQLQLPYPRKAPKIDKFGKRSYSTADDILSELSEEHEIVRHVQRYRMLTKLISTYTDKLPQLISKRTGRVHTSFNLAGTVTGRLSSSEPNLQNIPARTVEGRKIRCAFIAPAGYKIVSADYSQIELRLIAHFSQDANLITAFNNHQDIHRVTASEVLGKPLEEVTDAERSHAKATNFGLMYGMGAFGLARQTNMTSAEAKSYIERYFTKYPAIKSLMDKIVDEAVEQGYVTTLLGNHVVINGINNTGLGRRMAERAAINAPMQGSAADIIKKAMVEVMAYIQTLPADSVHMTLQVHDELVFEVKEEILEEFCAQVKTIMEQVVTLSVPLEVGIGVGKSWADAH